MDITEGYFSKHGSEKNAVSIARSAPKFFKGPSYPLLAPKWKLLLDYKLKLIDDSQYTQRYLAEVLATLDREEVRKDLEGKRIICWEGPGKFCHRHIVISWLNGEL